MPKLIDRDKRRTELVDAALHLVAEGGIEAATVAAVAERTRVVPGSVRYIFPTREALLDALASEVVSRTVEGVERRAGHYDRAERAVHRLTASLPLAKADLSIWSAAFAIEVGANRDPRLGGARADIHNARRGECQQVLAMLAGDLEVTPATMKFEVRRTHAIVEGLARQLLVEDYDLAAGEIRQVLELHLRGVQANWQIASTANQRKRAASDDAKARWGTHMAAEQNQSNTGGA